MVRNVELPSVESVTSLPPPPAWITNAKEKNVIRGPLLTFGQKPRHLNTNFEKREPSIETVDRYGSLENATSNVPTMVNNSSAGTPTAAGTNVANGSPNQQQRFMHHTETGSDFNSQQSYVDALPPSRFQMINPLGNQSLDESTTATSSKEKALLLNQGNSQGNSRRPSGQDNRQPVQEQDSRRGSGLSGASYHTAQSSTSSVQMRNQLHGHGASYGQPGQQPPHLLPRMENPPHNRNENERSKGSSAADLNVLNNTNWNSMRMHTQPFYNPMAPVMVNKQGPQQTRNNPFGATQQGGFGPPQGAFPTVFGATQGGGFPVQNAFPAATPFPAVGAFPAPGAAPFPGSNMYVSGAAPFRPANMPTISPLTRAPTSAINSSSEQAPVQLTPAFGTGGVEKKGNLLGGGDDKLSETVIDPCTEPVQNTNENNCESVKPSQSVPALHVSAANIKPASSWFVARKPGRLDPIGNSAQLGRNKRREERKKEKNNGTLTKELLDQMEKMSPTNQRAREIRKQLSQHGGPFTSKAEGIKKVEGEWKTVRQTTPIQKQRDENIALLLMEKLQDKTGAS